MLHTIPTDISELTNGEKLVIKKLKELYKNIDRDCYLYIQPTIRTLEPDFILIDSLKGVCILEVKDWGLNYIRAINKNEVVLADNRKVHNPSKRAVQYYNAVKSLFESEDRLQDEECNLKFKVHSKLILTNLSNRDITERDLEQFFIRPCMDYITSDELTHISLDILFGNDVCNITEDCMNIIRSLLFPEIKIIKKESIEDDFDEIRDDIIGALDVEQEKFAKRIPYGHYLVSGVPGSGKTVMLLSRAIFLAEKFPNWDILILTYNKSLMNKLKTQLYNLSSDLTYNGIDISNIEVKTFHKFALEIANINVPRNPSQEWWTNELPTEAMKYAKPTYDAILIDEYQDFYHSWIQLCLKCCKKHTFEDRKPSENMFLAGDRLQSIYNPNEISWKSLGLNVVGRSKLLKTTYRSGRSHIILALKFLINDPHFKREVEKFYEGFDGINAVNKNNNSIEFIPENIYKLNELLLGILSQEEFKPQDIMILVPYNKTGAYLYSKLHPSLKECSIFSRDVVDNKIVITTYHSSKGLESKICILWGINKISDKKLIYVGMTRASNKIYICVDNPDGLTTLELKKIYNNINEC
jgi:hypothetical protein